MNKLGYLNNYFLYYYIKTAGNTHTKVVAVEIHLLIIRYIQYTSTEIYTIIVGLKARNIRLQESDVDTESLHPDIKKLESSRASLD